MNAPTPMPIRVNFILAENSEQGKADFMRWLIEQAKIHAAQKAQAQAA